VRGDEVFLLAEADHDRRAVARRDDLLRVAGGDGSECVAPLEARHRQTHCLLQGQGSRVAGLFDEMGDDLGIGLGLELVTQCAQLALQLFVILDDAVVDDDERAAAVAVRVSVLLGGAAVGGPAGVPDAERPLEAREAQGFLQVAELACAPHDLESAAVHDRYAGGIIAAVFEAAEAVQEDRADLLVSDVPDDPAHSGSEYRPWRASRQDPPPARRGRRLGRGGAPTSFLFRIRPWAAEPPGRTASPSS